MAHAVTMPQPQDFIKPKHRALLIVKSQSVRLLDRFGEVFAAHPAAHAGILEDRARSNDRNRSARGEFEIGTVYRLAVFRGVGEGRVYSQAVEVRLGRMRSISPTLRSASAFSDRSEAAG